MKKYQIILCDPPWSYDDKKANNPAMGGIIYPTMSLSDIKLLKVNEISDKNCALFLWVTMPMLQEGLEVIKAWGFKYRTCAFCWVKQNPLGEGIYSGLGHWTNGNAELCLFAKKGTPKRQAKNVKQIILAPRSRHSEKPTEVRNRIVALMGDLPRIELFARKNNNKDLWNKNTFDGWDVLGNDIDGMDIAESIEKLQKIV